jgi:predicted NAD/FAD-binding protein
MSSQNIAIIGTGISGLGVASLLAPHHRITVYEKHASIGGHSRTVEVRTPEGIIPVDTGFIVFNDRNYPLLTRLFQHLNVPVAKSDMSFGASIAGGWLEYGTQHLGNMFAQKKNLLRPQFWGMIRDVMRFNRQALRFIESDPKVTLGECLDQLKMGEWFRRYYLLAMGGAIWSTPLDQMLQFPARTLVRFFDNHGLLAVSGQPQWYTVQGGSREYVTRLTAPFNDRIRRSCGAVSVRREAGAVQVTDVRGVTERYDQLVLACHSDQALALLENATDDERKLLGAFRYQPNRMILHSDTSLMPQSRDAWASWVYLSEQRRDAAPAVSLSYWMNRLQPLATSTPIIVTLNPARLPAAELIHDEATFEHPVFDRAAIESQPKLAAIQGVSRIWYCGAYQRYGFHEDGLASAVAVARQLGIEPPWK